MKTVIVPHYLASALLGLTALALSACDQVIDDRYEGLVLVPIEEVPLDGQTPSNPLDESLNGTNPVRVAVDLPRRRPGESPVRELTPQEAQDLAALAAEEAQLANSQTQEAEASLASAEERLAEAEAALAALQADLAAAEAEAAAAIAENRLQDETQALDLSALGLGADQAGAAVEITDALPPSRPDPFPQSFALLPAFLTAQAVAEAEAARQEAEAVREAEAARVAEAERLAAEQAAAAREAAAAAAAAAAQASAQAAAQSEAEQAAAEAAEAAARLVQTDSTPQEPELPRDQDDDQASALSIHPFSLPLTYADADPIAQVSDLQRLYQQIDFDLAALIAGGPTPGLILQGLPADLPTLGRQNQPLQRELFLKAVLPLCLVANGRIAQERVYVIDSLNTGEDVTQALDPVIRGLAAKYRATTRQDLLERVDTVPISLCLALAIVEADWGQMPQVYQDKALFGPWTSTGAAKSPDEARVSFDSLQAAAHALALYLNSASELSDFRGQRAQEGLVGRRLSGPTAAEYMADFGLSRPDLVSDMLQVMRNHQLDQYDLVRLQSPLQPIAVL